MRIALLSDIHANRHALEACLADVGRAGAQRIVLLGDLVGYGGEPAAVLNRIRAIDGVVIVQGNHDAAAVQPGPGMTADAAASARWTHGVLDAADRAFLAALPMEVREEDRHYVHADAAAPAEWTYVRDAEAARASLAASDARLVLHGHVHVPAIYGLTATLKLAPHVPKPGVAVPLLRARRWLAVAGAVGQPRDGEPAAAWSLLDPAASTLTLHRVPYDVAGAAAAIRAAGLPERLATRLAVGR